MSLNAELTLHCSRSSPAACAVFGASGFFSSRRFSSGLTGSSTATVRRPGVTYSQLSDLKSGKLKFEDVINMVSEVAAAQSPVRSQI
jgi:DNA-nicking Smr family endonuclease